VEGFRAPRCASDDKNAPTPNGVREVDSLNGSIGVMDEKARLLKSTLESVTKFRVAHGVAPRKTRYGSMRTPPHNTSDVSSCSGMHGSMSWPIKELANQGAGQSSDAADGAWLGPTRTPIQILTSSKFWLRRRGNARARNSNKAWDPPPGSDCTDEADIQLTVEHMLSGMPVSAQGALDREISFSDGKPFVGHNCSRNTSQRPQF
jgi:hypothetical protein